MRRIYLKRLDLEKAKKLFFESIKLQRESERIKTVDSLFRITSQKVLSKKYVPDFTSAAMDGAMIKFEDSLAATLENPVYLDDFKWVNTGRPILPPYNAVVMIEDLLEKDGKIEIRKSYSPWENIRLIGEDYGIQDLVLPANHKITPEDITTLLDTGNTTVNVYKKLKVAVIPTGDELVNDPGNLSEGKVLETNSHMYANYLRLWGCDVDVFAIVKDELDSLIQNISSIADKYDVIISIAGSSAGSKDFTATVVEELGELIAHGVNLKPGKPLVLGNVKNKPFIGIPGYPAAGYTDFMIFVKGLVDRFYNQPIKENTVDCYVGKNMPSNYSVDEYIRVVVGKIDGRYVLSPLKRGSAPMKPLVESDGYVNIEKGKEGINEGEIVKVFLNGKCDIDKNIIFIGSNDILIDILRNELKKYGYNLKVSNQGSMSAITARIKKLSHFGGLHLLNPEDGSYNNYYVKKFLSKDYVLMNLSYRMQGIITLKDNPKKIKDLNDLTKCLFVNRQVGSGTRVLLDYLLDKNSINRTSIKGYNNVEFTHSGVCTRIINNNADCGIGIYSVAKIFDLNFIPIGEERYDLLIDKSFYDSKSFSIIMNFINSKEFKDQVEKLGGYDLRDSGKLILSE